MLVDDLYDKCMSKNEFKLYAGDVKASLESPFSLYCKYHGDLLKKDPEDPFLQFLSIKGDEHKIKEMEKYPDSVEISYTSINEGFKSALTYMEKGINMISNAPIFYMPEGFCGFPDVLEKRDGKSVFGKHMYINREIKIAKNIKDRHIIQAAFHALILGNIQGITPTYFLITNLNNATEKYMYEEYENLLLENIMQAKKIINGWMPGAVYNGGIHPWINYSNEMAIKNNDVSLINGIGKSKRNLFIQAGYDAVDKIASANISDLLEINGVGEKTSKLYINSAIALTKQIYIKHKNVELPHKQTEIFLDLEGSIESIDDTIDDYLIGALVRINGIEKYHSFIAIDKHEDLMLKSFVDFMEKQSDYVIYHWHHYERIHLKNMMDRHGIDAYHLLEPDVMLDLAKISTDAFTFPTYSNSIKNVAKYLGFKWRHANVGATSSLELYLDYVKDPIINRDKMQLVLDYNEDDCIGTRVIKDWLKN